jgi:hypothetical protein
MNGPSAYVPFTRRFGSERDREFQETRELYARLKPHHDAQEFDTTSLGRPIYRRFDHLPEAVSEAVAYALYDLLAPERYLFDLPPPEVERMSMEEFVEYRNLLLHKQYFLANRDRLLAAITETLEAVLAAALGGLPVMEEPTPFTIPLVYALPRPRELFDRIVQPFFAEELVEAGLFREAANQLITNLYAASGRIPDQNPRPPKPARESDLPLDAFVDTFFKGTPFVELLSAPVPLRLSREDRFSHMHILAGSGHGKTTLIERLIRHDIASDDPPSIVLIDPHSDLVRKLARSDLGIEDRILLLDPRDTAHPLAINPFAINRERFATYDETTREQVTAGVIQTLTYLWNGLTNLTLTGKQDVFARYVIRLLLTIPEVRGENATILDMLKLMSDPTQYADVIEELPDIPQEFFRTDFQLRTFDGTKEQVRYRIQAIIENPTLARLFTSPETKVDFYQELNRGAVILIDSAKDFLKPEASAIFSKLIISLILQAVYERAAIPEQERKPAFIYIDEAASAFSQNVDDLLSEARKFKAGLALSHQYLDQATSQLRSSLAANTGIKFAGGLSAGDARSMAPEMRTSADYILEQPKLQFAAYIRNVTPSAVGIPVSPVKSPPQLPDDAYANLIASNRSQVSIPRSQPPRRGEPEPPNDDISPDW